MSLRIVVGTGDVGTGDVGTEDVGSVLSDSSAYSTISIILLKNTVHSTYSTV